MIVIVPAHHDWRVGMREVSLYDSILEQVTASPKHKLPNAQQICAASIYSFNLDYRPEIGNGIRMCCKLLSRIDSSVLSVLNLNCFQ